MRRFQTFLVGALWLVCMAAQAQWQWLDKSGRKVFSDQPPPPDIPLRSIIKQPGKAALSAGVPATQSQPLAATGAAGTAAPAAAPSPPLREGDKELLANKQKAEADKLAQAKVEVERLAAIKASNCEKARASQTLLDSGVRVSVTNAKGEREVLDDTARAEQHKKVLSVIEADCR